MNDYTLCGFDDGILHIREPDPGGRAVCFVAHSMPVAPLCATPGGHPIGRDVPGDVGVVLASGGEATAGVCRFCARAWLERRASAEAEARARLRARGVRVSEPAARTPANVVADLRLGLRVSQAGLARRLGTTQTVVSRWETGKHKPHRSAWAAMRGLAAGGGDRCAKVLREIDSMKEAYDGRP